MLQVAGGGEWEGVAVAVLQIEVTVTCPTLLAPSLTSTTSSAQGGPGSIHRSTNQWSLTPTWENSAPWSPVHLITLLPVRRARRVDSRRHPQINQPPGRAHHLTRLNTDYVQHLIKCTADTIAHGGNHQEILPDITRVTCFPKVLKHESTLMVLKRNPCMICFHLSQLFTHPTTTTPCLLRM